MSTSSSTGPQRLGKYELQEKLGFGGVAEVWKALDTELHRYVAIKLLHANLRTDPDFMARFTREARLIAALHHPNIVQIHDFQTTHSSETNAPVAYMVMDYVEGETLADYIRATSRVGKFPAPTDIVHLFASISKAIDYAHQEGTIHRDIKPANILLDKRHRADNPMGEPVLTDFGIAKMVGASSETMTGIILGTPRYISPEQALGYPATERSDIYALGVILYVMCTGVYPFESESSTGVMMQHITAAPPPPDHFNPTIPPALTTVILSAMAKDPAERFSSASALTVAMAEAFNVPVPAGLSPFAHPSNPLMDATPRQPDLSPYIMLQKAQQSQPSLRRDYLAQTAPTVLVTPQFTDSPAAGVKTPTPVSPSPPVAKQNAQATPPRPVSVTKPSPPVGFWRAWRGNRIAWIVVSLVLIASIIVSVNVFKPGQASPTSVGTLTFTDSGQYNAASTVGYNDIVSLSLHNLTNPQTGQAYFAWLLPDQGDDNTVPLLLGRLSVNAGNATLQYTSPTNTNLFAQYSRVSITEQPANNDPNTPSLNPRWQGSIPNTPTPGDPNQYSLLSHLRHLLAKDPILQANHIPGGLVLWLTRNAGKVQEWSSAAQGDWGAQMSDGNADQLHNQLIRILDYLDGQTYVGLDVPSGSPWLADPNTTPSPQAKFGLLSYTQGQDPPGYLQHVNAHLMGLTDSPGHTDEQKQIAMQIDDVIQRMTNDLTQVHKDAALLVKRNNDQLRQTDTLTKLNEMASLTGEVNSGWFDATTHENVGGSIWLNARIHQLATISLQTSSS